MQVCNQITSWFSSRSLSTKAEVNSQHGSSLHKKHTLVQAGLFSCETGFHIRMLNTMQKTIVILTCRHITLKKKHIKMCIHSYSGLQYSHCEYLLQNVSYNQTSILQHCHPSSKNLFWRVPRSVCHWILTNPASNTSKSLPPQWHDRLLPPPSCKQRSHS